MLLIRNKAVVETPLPLTTGDVIPFDTVVYATNDNTALNGNYIQFFTPGVYSTDCTVDIANTDTQAAHSCMIQEYANGVAIEGALATATIPAGGSETITFPWAVNVKAAAEGIADISWRITGTNFSLVNAVARVSKYV